MENKECYFTLGAMVAFVLQDLEASGGSEAHQEP